MKRSELAIVLGALLAAAPFTGSVRAQLAQEVVRLNASDASSGDRFGVFVSHEGGYLAIGAMFDDDSGADSGAAYVHERGGSVANWSEVAKVSGSDAGSGDRFGRRLSLSGDILVVGSVFHDHGGLSNSGGAYVFQRDLGGADVWGALKELVPSDPGSNKGFGNAVAISGDVIAISGGSNAGTEEVWLFGRDQGGSDNWGEITSFSAPDGTSGDAFGTFLTLSDSTLVVGASKDDDAGSNAGAVYVFERDFGGLDAWGHTVKFSGADTTAGDEFGGGNGLALAGDLLVVGANLHSGMGAAYVFERTGQSWNQISKLAAPDGASGDRFGWGVAIHEAFVAVGNIDDDDAGSNSGSVYLFERDVLSGLYSFREKAVPSDAGSDDELGDSLVLADDLMAVASNHNDVVAPDAGSVWLFELVPPIGVETLVCVGFEPPLAVSPITIRGKNRALPLKAQLIDASGDPVGPADITSPPVVQVLFSSSAGGGTVDVSDQALPAGHGDNGNQFTYTDELKWQFNLKTGTFTAAGSYSISMISGDAASYRIDPSCSVIFER